MEEKIKQIVSSVLNISQADINDQTAMANIPVWDSLMHLSLVEALESNFSMRFTIEEITQLTSYKKIKEILAAKGLVSLNQALWK